MGAANWSGTPRRARACAITEARHRIPHSIPPMAGCGSTFLLADGLARGREIPLGAHHRSGRRVLREGRARSYRPRRTPGAAVRDAGTGRRQFDTDCARAVVAATVG